MQDPQIERAFFNGFPSGYYPNRNPLAPPSDRGEDVLIDGGDLLHTDHLTWLRRPGLSKWSNQAVSSATNVQSFFSQELVNSVNVFADRTTDVYEMTTTSATVLFNKGISTQNCYFASVGDSVYITHDDNQTSPESSAVLDLGDHSVAPTVSAPYKRRLHLPAVIGSGYVWTFPKGMRVKAGEGLGIVTPTAVAGQACDIYFAWEE